VNLLALTDMSGYEQGNRRDILSIPPPSKVKHATYSNKNDNNGGKGLTNVVKSDHQSPPTKNDANANENKTQEKPTDRKKNDLPFTPVCEPVPDSTLSSLIFYAPIALNFVYAESEVDMQILAAQQGWRLVYAHLHQEEGHGSDQVGDMPASALFVHMERKIACFAIRGTATINDVVTDIRQMPVQFPDVDDDEDGGRLEPRTSSGVGGEPGFGDEEGWTPVFQGKGLALCGMAGAAYNLFRENIDTLLLFARKGYRIRLTGHSMGGSVAALMGSLVQRHFDLKIREGDELGKIVHDADYLRSTADTGEFKCKNDTSTPISRSDLIRVYSYGSPACVDAKLSDFVQPYVITCVLHDDVVPRLTPTSIRGLMKHLLYIRETWVKAHLANDLMAIKERAKTAWAPKVRNGFSLLSAKTSSFKVYGKKLKMKRKLLKRKMMKGCTSSSEKTSGTTCDRLDASNSTQEDQTATDDSSYRDHCTMNSECEPNSGDGGDGGDEGDASDEGLYYEGDCFYEADDSLIEQSDEENTDDETERYGDSTHGNTVAEKDGWEPFEDENVKKTPSEIGSMDSSPAVLLDEIPLPRMFIPGKIVHIYTHRGGYKATFVPSAFRDLRQISLAGNMINDHTSKWYFEALLECRSIRNADGELPEWTGFREETACSCCASLFTWASTSDS